MPIPAKVLSEKPLDIDGHGETPVQILDTGFRYPLLARWPDRRSPQNHCLWAVAGHFIAHLPDAKNLDAISRVLDRQDLQIRRLSAPDVYRIGPTPSSPDFDKVSRSGAVLEKLVELRKTLGGDALVEPDHLYFVAQADFKPNDGDLELQTYLQLTHVRESWKVQRGSRSVKVAIIDTGVDTEHPDLKDNILRDANGEIVGWDYHNGLPSRDDDQGHGTICAGLVGAVGNNGIGIAGVNWEVSILPIKAFDSSGAGASSHTAAAVQYAIDHQADVILCAWGSGAESISLRAALERANRAGILVVAAAGNDPLDLDQDGPGHFPASFAGSAGLENLISVGGCDDKGVPVKQWGHGEKRVHLYAPGVQVYSTVPARFRPILPYDRANGTSPAAALVAGACALLKAQFPQESHLQIRDRLLRSLTPNRILDVRSAMKPDGPGGGGGKGDSAYPPPIPPPSTPDTGTEGTFRVDLAPEGQSSEPRV